MEKKIPVELRVLRPQSRSQEETVNPPALLHSLAGTFAATAYHHLGGLNNMDALSHREGLEALGPEALVGRVGPF